MRAIFFGCVVVVLLVASNPSATSAEPPEIREFDKLLFEGVEKVAVGDIRTALRADFDVLLAGHPDAPLAGCLRAVEAAMRLGYHHSGFRDAKVTAEYDESRERIVVCVEEGPRNFCGEINVVGLQQADKKLIIDALTREVKNVSTPWAHDCPVPFDDLTHNEVRHRLKDAFAAQGFFSPRFHAQIVAEPTREATLEVTIESEGPRAEIDHVTISGNERDSEQSLLDYLGLHRGQPYDSGLAERLKARLEASGRFLGAKIDRASPVRVFDGGRELIDLSIEVNEYEHAPALSSQLSEKELAVLRLGNWIERWARGETEEDIQVTLSLDRKALSEFASQFGPAAHDFAAPVDRVSITCVFAPRHGQTIVISAFDGQQKPIGNISFISDARRVLIAAPLRNAKLELLHGGHTYFTMTSELRASSPKELKSNDNKFQFKLGLTVHKRRKDENSAASPLDATAKVAPVTMLGLLYADGTTRALNDGTLSIESGTLTARLDAATGRLLELAGHTNDGMTVVIQAKKDAFLAAAQGIEQQISEPANVYDTKAYWKSLCQFLFDEAAFLTSHSDSHRRTSAALAAAGKLFSHWSPPAIANLWPSDDASATKDDPSRFLAPAQSGKWDLDDIRRLNSPGGRTLVVLGLRIFSRLAPIDGWLWPTSRDVGLFLASGAQVPLASLWSRVQADELGPLGHLLIASLSPGWRPYVAARGQNQNSCDSFHKDCQPLLSGDGWLSHCLLSLIEAARSLDEADLQSLADFAHDDAARATAATVLLTLQEKQDEPVAAAASRMLDALWTVALRDVVTAKLRKLAPPVAKSPIQWSKLSADELEQHLKKLGLGAKEAKTQKPAEFTPISPDKSRTELIKAWERYAEQLQNSAAESDKTPRDDIRVSERTKSATPGAFAPSPLDKETKSQKSWLEQPPAPRKPLSPFPSSGPNP
jgi:hypothetical protein